ncbi:MAG TPA: hypothetical protein VGE38_13990 [Nocardioides sp.]|uniref:hypothetical protein n=1 Tax=Nocardioides sp. TaxID=35761 RepID=UPI002ED83AD5
MRAVRARLMGWGACAALVSGMLVAAPPPAVAADVSKVLDYTCTPNGLLSSLLGSEPFSLPIELDALDEVEREIGAAPLDPILGSSTGLSELLGELGVTGATLLSSVEGLVFTLEEATYRPEVELATGALSLPSLPIPSEAGTYELTAPDSFTVTSMLSVLTGTVTCALDPLDPLDPVVTRLLVRAPGPETDGPVVTPGPETPGTGTPGTGEDATTAVDPCVAVPAPRAGQRPTTLKAKAEARSWKKKPAVALTVKARKKPARGTVVACYGTLKIGQATLKKGKATLRTVRFYPGRYRFKLVYLGSATAKPKAKTVLVKVKRR